jgi:hypothetical protein
MATGFLTGGAVLTAMAAMGNELRDLLDEKTAELVGGAPKTPETNWRQAEQAISYSGLTGRLDPLLQLISGTRYQRSPAETIMGPAVGQVSDGLTDFLSVTTGVRNSENTNTAERSAADTFHRMILTPMMQAALTGVPMAGPAGRALVMGSATAGVRSTREPTVEALAGEESADRQKRRMSQPLKGFTEELVDGNKKTGSSRGTSRSAGRSGGRESGR